VSTRRPRYRYIAFRVEGPRAFRHDEVLEALRTTPLRLRLVEFADGSGLVRTTHLEKDAAIRAVNGIGSIGGERVHVTTVGTSGTIRAATRKYLSRTDGARRELGKNPYK
jgi:RNase P/RNase MRP subunit POP5